MSFAILVELVNGSKMTLREIIVHAKNPSILEGAIPFCTTYMGETDIQVNFIVSKGGYTSDTLTVAIGLVEVDENNGVRYYDTDISIHNNDFASLRDQGDAISFALDAFYKLKFDSKFGELVGS